MRRFAVLGLGRFGMTLSLHLARYGADVIAVDRRRELVDEIADRVAHAVILDATDERALRAQGIPEVDCAIVAIGENFEANVLATITCKNFGIPCVIARSASENQTKILERIGTDTVLQPEEETARRLARQLLRPTIISIQELAEGLSAVQIQAPEHFLERTLVEIDLRNRYGVTLVAIRRPEEEEPAEGKARPARLVFPKADTRIQKGDVLVLVGPDRDLEVLTGGEEAA